MSKIMNHTFVKMAKQGITGAVLGIVAGLILGILIYVLQLPLVYIGQIGNSYNGSGMMFMSAAQPGSLGMAFGAIIGAIFGAISGLKNKQDE